MWWGVAAALLANVLYSTGFVLEKRALAKLPALNVRRPAHLLRHLLRSPLWIAGSLALAGGFAAQLIVYRTLPMAASQALFVSGLVLLLLLSHRFLGERTSRRERCALAAVLLALLMVVGSLRQDADSVGRSSPYALILLISAMSLGAAFALYATTERRSSRRHRAPTTNGVEYAVAVGFVYGVSSLAIKGVSAHLTPAALDDPAAAAQALLTSPYPYLLLITGATGLLLSQTALQRCRASLVVPVCTTTSCLYTAVVGTFAFGESLPDDPLLLALRLTGATLAVAVLLTLTANQETPQPRQAPPTPHTPEMPDTQELSRDPR
ncbi:DMT family transporter [Streptomyces sp. NPDC055287]